MVATNMKPSEVTVTENTTTVPMEPPDFDALLAEAAKEFQHRNRPQYSMPQVLGEYRAIEGKPGLYALPMCLEVELRALELYTIYSDGTAVGLARVAAGLATAVLHRVRLPLDEAEAREKITGYVRGEVPEDEIFVPLTEKEVGRIFKSTDELTKLVLDPLNISFLSSGEEDPKNE